MPLSLDLPRAVTSIHQIEVTSNCNLRCVYCTSPNLQRPKMDMPRATFEKALELANYYVRAGTQQELNLAGIGESTIHPDFPEYIALAREAVGPDTKLTLATNGITMTQELADVMAEHNMMVWVSLHRPEKAAHAVNLLKKVGILKGVSVDAAAASMNWAGQVDWPIMTQPRMCQWISNGFVMVMADGRLTKCCLDSSGSGVICHIDEFDPDKHKTRPYSLCRKCDQSINITGYDQQAETYKGIKL